MSDTISMKNPSTDISFIILTWNSRAYIEKCLDSLLSALAQTDFHYHIYITDNGSTDATPDILQKLKKKLPSAVTLFLLDRNMGTTYSRNLGLKQADSRYICIMDSDVEVIPGTIEALAAFLEKDNHAGLAVPKIVYPDGRLQKSTDRFPTMGRKIYRYFFLKKMEATERLKAASQTPIPVDYAISAFWLLKKSVTDQAGLLDENIFYSPEDVDYCLRIWKSGHAIMYLHEVCVIHHTQEISRGLKFNTAFFNHIKGLCYYFSKHHYFFFPPNYKKKRNVNHQPSQLTPMKTLHILNHSFPLLDGYASRSQSIFNAQKNMGYSPVILTSPKHEEDWKKPCAKKETIEGFDFYRTGKNPCKARPVLGELVQMAMVLFKLARVITIEKPTVLHAHSPVLNAIPAWIAGKWFGLPVVYEIRAFWEDAGVDQATYKKQSAKYKLVKYLETWVCRHVDHVAVLCEGIRKDLAGRGIDNRKMTPVFNGIHPKNFTPCLPDQDLIDTWQLSDKKVIGFIGSFYRYEGLDLLIKAFADMAPAHPDLVLLLVGGGEMEARLKQDVTRYNIGSQVLMPGRIPHHRIKGVYALIDILVYPRYSVRLTELVTPLKPLEAMAMGKAVIASDIGGHRELIADKKTGLLFTAGDAAALSAAIQALLENPALMETLGKNGINHVMNHKTWQTTTAVYNTIYSMLPKRENSHVTPD